MMEIRFTVPGRVVGKKRPRTVSRGAFVSTYTPKETVAYESLVGLMASSQLATKGGAWKMSGVSYAVVVHIFVNQVKSKKSPRCGLPRKVDVDNVAKSVLDGLEGVAFDNDDDVTWLLVMKEAVVGEERVNVEVRVRETPKKDRGVA